MKGKLEGKPKDAESPERGEENGSGDHLETSKQQWIRSP